MVFSMDRRAAVVMAAIVLVGFTIPLPPGAGHPAEPVPALHLAESFYTVHFHPTASVLACDLVLRDIASGKVLGTGDAGEKMPRCTCVAFSPDGKRLASVHFARGLIHAPHALCLWNITTDHLVSRAATLLHAENQ